MSQEKKLAPELSSWQVLKTVAKLANVSLREQVWSALCFVGLGLCATLAPLGIKSLANLMIAGSSHSPWLSIIFVASMLLVGMVFDRLGIYLLIRSQVVSMYTLYEAAFLRALQKSHSLFLDEFVGRVVKRIARLPKMLEFMNDLICRDAPELLTVFVGSIIAIGLTQPVTAAMLAVAYLIGAFALVKVVGWRLHYRREWAEAESKMSGLVSDAVGNQNTIRLFNGYAHEADLFDVGNSDLKHKTRRSWMVGFHTWTGQSALTWILTIAALSISVWRWQKHLVSPGDVIATFTYVSALAAQLGRVRQLIRQYFETLEEIRESLELILDPREMRDHESAKPLRITQGAVDFRAVNFNYGAGELLDGFSLKIKGGEKIALCGPSGAGKSTLIKLLLRLHETVCDSIFIDGQSIRLVTQSSLRQHIALVPQDAQLFHRSLRENIRYGRMDATDEEIIAAAKLAHCHEFISVLPQGYDTTVGERGVKLSGGERQRVALARAFLSRAKILLIDEGTSQLDSRTESLIHESLKALMKDRTVIIIAHRLSTIREADRIVVMEHGRIVDQGTHDELVKRGGLYSTLWSVQAGAYKPEPSSLALN